MRSAWTRRTLVLALVGFLGSFLVLLDALASSYLPKGPLALVKEYAPILRQRRKIFHLLGCFGSVLLFAAWIKLRPTRGSRLPILAITALWCLPLLLSPPVMTADPYAYAAQGWLLATGQDPYSVPMGTKGPYSAGVYVAWRPTTAVYPPYALFLQQAVVQATGFHPWWGVVGMRAIALAGVALMAVATILLARQHGLSRDLALWGVVANPLIVVQLIGGAHNDTIMIGLVMMALWLAGRNNGLLTGAALIGVAAMFKQPAVIAGLGVVMASLPEHLRTRPVKWLPILGRLVVGAAIGGGVFVVLSLLSGLGFGWMNDGAGSPSLVINHSPFSWAAQWALHVAHVPQAMVDTALSLVSAAFMAVGFAVVIWRFALRRPIMMTAGLLLVFGVLGSAIQPWYVLWGGPLLALAGVTRRTGRIACAVVLLLLFSAPLGWLMSPAIHVPIAAAVAVAWFVWAERRARHHDEENEAEAVAAG